MRDTKRAFFEILFNQSLSRGYVSGQTANLHHKSGDTEIDRVR